MSATARKRQAGNMLFTIGALLFVFALVLVMFVPSDIRSGHHFWTAVFGIDLILAGVLAGVGYRIRKRMGPG